MINHQNQLNKSMPSVVDETGRVYEWELDNPSMKYNPHAPNISEIVYPKMYIDNIDGKMRMVRPNSR